MAFQNFRDAGINYVSLSDYNILIEVALENNIILEQQIENLKAWRENPGSWQ